MGEALSGLAGLGQHDDTPVALLHGSCCFSHGCHKSIRERSDLVFVGQRSQHSPAHPNRGDYAAKLLATIASTGIGSAVDAYE